MIKPEYNFEKMYSQYYRQVHSFIHRLCRNSALTEKLSQKTFLRAYREISKRTDAETVLLKLQSIAVGIILRYLKSVKKAEIPVEIFISVPDAGLYDEPGYRICKSIDASRASEVLHSFSGRDCSILLMHLCGNADFKALGSYFGISPESAELIYTKTMETVKEELFND